MLPRNLIPQMGLAEGAAKDEAGYLCPACGRTALAANEMAEAWSAAGYVPVVCLKCHQKAAGRLSAAGLSQKTAERER